jgi:molecular chaperone GrpE
MEKDQNINSENQNEEIKENEAEEQNQAETRNFS